MIVWTLAEGLSFIREISPKMRACGYGLALAGSLLARGESEKDLDLVVYPLDKSNTQASSIDNLQNALAHNGGRISVVAADVHRGWRRRGSNDCKHVEVWQFPIDGVWRRVVVLFLS